MTDWVPIPFEAIDARESFEEHVREGSRFVPHDSAYLQQLIEDCLASPAHLQKGQVFHRARRMPVTGHGNDEPLELTPHETLRGTGMGGPVFPADPS